MMLYPISRRPPTTVEQLALKSRYTVGFCTICGRWTALWWGTENFRESGVCRRCQSTNRHRQVAYVLCIALTQKFGAPIRALPDIARGRYGSNFAIYNTETSGPLHDQLRRLPNYVCSEYFGPGHEPGETVNGVRHEDLQQLSFADSSFDVILSSDVFEHVPDPYAAFREVHRVLKPGGRHIFTVPFHQTEFRDDVRAVVESGETKLLKDPIYHLDPLRPEGILVYTIFALEMLVRLDDIGFRTHMHLLYAPWLGILSNNALVFEAVKS